MSDVVAASQEQPHDDDWIPPAHLRVMTVDQVMRFAGICRPKFYEEVREGRLIARKIGRRTFVTVADFERYLNTRPRLFAEEVSA